VFSSEFPWATFGVIGLTAIIALVGGAVVIWGHNGALSFNDYINAMWKFALAAGLLGVGRGVKSGLENGAAASSKLSDVSLLSELQSLAGTVTGNGQAQGQADPAAAAAAAANPVEIVSHV
jgi:heme A synthase